MNEFFLHYVWQYQVLSRSPLVTTQGKSLQVLSTGFHNAHAGPDFQCARLLIDEVEWFGHVEIHWKSSDWKSHGHEQDAAYNSVILHVVWEEDTVIQRPEGTPMPTVELVTFVSPGLYKKYRTLIRDPGNSRFIPCASSERLIPPEILEQAIQRALLDRINQKVDTLQVLFESTQQNWEETAYRWSALGFGFSLHKEAMAALSERVPYIAMARLRQEPEALEALYFGMSGLLPKESEDPKVMEWIELFRFYQRKYTWSLRAMDSVHWKFGRTRPSNFPTLRLAQWIAFLQKTEHIHSTFVEVENLSQAKNLFQVTLHPFWQARNRFEKTSAQPNKSLPEGAIHRLITNILIPYQVWIGRYWDHFDLEKRAYQWLFELPPENNSLLTQWTQEMQISVSCAGEAQGLMGLYHHHCTLKRCALCPVGQYLFRT